MAVLLTYSEIQDGKEKTFRCDTNCYNAVKPICKCPCKGRYHGLGLVDAQAKLAQDARDKVIIGDNMQIQENNGKYILIKLAELVKQF